jgi:hypothetical protein
LLTAFRRGSIRDTVPSPRFAIPDRVRADSDCGGRVAHLDPPGGAAGCSIDSDDGVPAPGRPTRRRPPRVKCAGSEREANRRNESERTRVDAPERAPADRPDRALPRCDQPRRSGQEDRPGNRRIRWSEEAEPPIARVSDPNVPPETQPP